MTLAVRLASPEINHSNPRFSRVGISTMKGPDRTALPAIDSADGGCSCAREVSGSAAGKKIAIDQNSPQRRMEAPTTRHCKVIRRRYPTTIRKGTAHEGNLDNE